MLFSKKKMAVVCRSPEDQKTIEKEVKKRFRISKKPDYIICYGGDGTLLIAERKYPGVPKILYKNSEHANKFLAYDHPIGYVLEKVSNKEYEIINHYKLSANLVRDDKVIGEYECVNEFNIRNQLLFQALRFKIYIDDKLLFDKELIGDGCVIATPYGSTGYYYSITKSSFDDGIGIGLNNIRDKKTGVHTTKDKIITVEITRMPAEFAIDNDPEIIILNPKDKLVVTTSAKKLKIVRIRE